MSSSVDYNVYRQEIINFLQTVSIKFSLFSEYAKISLQKNGIPTDTLKDSENPYYLNLCGQYSQIDEPIYITILETGEKEILSREILAKYPKTASIYRVPNKEYENLLAAHPTKQGLIKSIIYPAKDIDTVLQARDLTLLNYDDSLLETNEKNSLIEALKTFLDYTYNRWFVKDFNYEPAYAITFMGLLWSILPTVLLTQRVRNLKTPQVHSMHIWEYLDSKGLGEYKYILTNKQAYFLYRNIDYLIKNKGKKTNIEILAENLLEGIHLKLVGKTILLETASSTISSNVDNIVGDIRYALESGDSSGLDQSNMAMYEQLKKYSDKPDELKKQLEGLKEQLLASATDCIVHPEFLSDDIVSRTKNHTENIDESRKQSMNEILYRIHTEGYYPEYSAENSEEMDSRFGLSTLNNIPTRLLEFEKAILNTRYLPYLTEFLVDSLLYQWSRGTITYRIKFTDPHTNIKLDLDIGDALVLLYYIHHKTSGTIATVIPTRYTSRICYPSHKPSNLPTTWTFNNFKYTLDSFIDTEEILNDIVFDNGPFNTIDQFMSRMANQFGSLLKHTRQVRSNSGTQYQQAMLYFYNYLVVHKTFNVTLTKYSDYASWLNSNEVIRNLINAYDELGSPKDYYQDLCNTIWSNIFPVESMPEFDEYTGADKDNSPIYAGLKKLFIQLCSYRLFFLETDRAHISFMTVPFTAMYTNSGHEYIDAVLEFASTEELLAKEVDDIESTLLIELLGHKHTESNDIEVGSSIDVEDFSKFTDMNLLTDNSIVKTILTNDTDRTTTNLNVSIADVYLTPIN